MFCIKLKSFLFPCHTDNGAKNYCIYKTPKKCSTNWKLLRTYLPLYIIYNASHILDLHVYSVLLIIVQLCEHNLMLLCIFGIELTRQISLRVPSFSGTTWLVMKHTDTTSLSRNLSQIIIPQAPIETKITSCDQSRYQPRVSNFTFNEEPGYPCHFQTAFEQMPELNPLLLL